MPCFTKFNEKHSLILPQTRNKVSKIIEKSNFLWCGGIYSFTRNLLLQVSEKSV